MIFVSVTVSEAYMHKAFDIIASIRDDDAAEASDVTTWQCDDDSLLKDINVVCSCRARDT